MIEEYRQQIHRLAGEINCGLVIKNKMHGMMYVEFGYIEVPRILNQEDYVVNLHELGHFSHGHTQGRPPKLKERFYFDNGVLHSEAQAWEWAMDHTLDALTPATKKFMWIRCLGTYYLGYRLSKGRLHRLYNGDRAGVQFYWDKPDEYFHSIAERMEAEIK